MGPGAARASVCLSMAKEAVVLHRLRPGPSGFTTMGNYGPHGEVGAREIAGPCAAIGKWRDPIPGPARPTQA